MTARLLTLAGLALALASAAGCARPDPTVPDRPAPPPRFLALGDSYTVGEGVETAATWPFVVARRLRAEGVPLADPTVVATTGWTTDELDAAITEQEDDLTPPYALVTLLVGVNDQYRGRPADGFRAPFRALLARAVAFAGGEPGRVVVVSIPDWGVTPFAGRPASEGAEAPDRAAVAAGLDAYNAIAREEAAAAGARWADVTALSRANPDEVTDDGLHPSADAYARWAGAIAPEARAALAG